MDIVHNNILDIYDTQIDKLQLLLFYEQKGFMHVIIDPAHLNQ